MTRASSQAVREAELGVPGPYRTATFARLNQPLSAVLGSPTAKVFEAIGVRTVEDLMQHTPRHYVSGTQTTRLANLRVGERVALIARVGSMHRAGVDPRLRLEVVLTDGHDTLDVTFFGREHLVSYWQRQLSRGDRGIFVGKVGTFQNKPQLTHPDFVMLDAEGRIVGRADETKRAMADVVTRSGMIGLYPASAKLPTWQIAACAWLVLDSLQALPDPLPEWVRVQADLMDLLAAFEQLHRPTSPQLVARAQRRLKYQEALNLQVTMAYRRAAASRRTAPPIVPVSGGLLDALDARLPFTLTSGQRQVSSEILADLGRNRPMQRLLQGEVGSGKTVVALRAMLAVVDAGHQAALLAPTEVLAVQHYRSVLDLLGPLAFAGQLGAPEVATKVALLTGSTGAGQRQQALSDIANGAAGIVVGTHALLQDAVRFQHLGLVVVDEQHRFGVEQRARLADQGTTQPHELVLTATPIPRSVAMTVFGDLEVSTLAEIPQGRQEVQTTVVHARRHPAWVDRAWQRIREEVVAGRQAFVVCPRISAQDADPVGTDGIGSASATVEDTYRRLADGPLTGLRIDMLHGKLTSAVKDEVMTSFAAGELDVLVATMVVEVGVDIPNASMMVVLDADRFGISQLHQLRGRIGRGPHPGVCLLVTAVPEDTPAYERLTAVAASRDGFQLAELDLAQRREGDVLGAEQAGTHSTLRLLRVLDDADIIATSREIAERLVAQDPDRQDPYLDDMVTSVERRVDSEWLERG